VWQKGEVIFIALISSLALQIFLQQVLVRFFLCSGPFTIVRPELYSIWHFVGLILGVFTGLIRSVARWILALVFVTFLYARLDYAIYPKSFTFLDKSHQGFVSVVVVEAKNSNALYLLFSSLLILRNELRRLASKGVQEVVVDDKLFGRSRVLSSGIINMCRILLRRQVGADLDLRVPPPNTTLSIFELSTDNRQLFLRKERVRHRFFLWMVLTNNPSLKKLRKHALYEESVLEGNGRSLELCQSASIEELQPPLLKTVD
jgi:hypothetical protein